MKSSDSKIIIGIDVGGTKIMAGAIYPDGELACEPLTVDTNAGDDGESIAGRILDSIDKICRVRVSDSSEILGMGVTGPLDPESGTILECPQLPTMHFYPLKQKVAERFNIPVFMDNDANALLLGESVWGAGRGHRTTLGFTLGTGLGCAIVNDKRLFTGTNGMAGEIWPSPLGGGIIEDIVSGQGVSSTYFKLSNQKKTSKEIASLAREGDADAIETWNIFGATLAIPLAWGINFIDPGIVILGGSIANSTDLFINSLEGALRKHLCPVPALKTRIVRAELGDSSGFIGAAALVMQA